MVKKGFAHVFGRAMLQEILPEDKRSEESCKMGLIFRRCGAFCITSRDEVRMIRKGENRRGLIFGVTQSKFSGLLADSSCVLARQVLPAKLTI